MICAVLALAAPAEMAPARFELRAPAAKTVVMRGDLLGWERDHPLKREANGTWSLNVRVPRAARIEYKFVVDGVWQLDPRAPRGANGLGGENSIWTGPDYRAVAPVQPPARRNWGQIQTTLTSKEGYEYAVEMWRPPQDARDMPVLIYNDGSGYAEYAQLPNQVQNLVAARQLPPVVLVLVTSPNRERDYWKEPEPYLAFVGTRLLPWVRQTTGAVARREHTLMGGASLGGLISLRAARTMPDTFGMVHAQSPSMWGEPALAAAPELKRARLAIDGGLFEGFPPVGDELARHQNVVLRQDRPEGHTWSQWRETVAPALKELLRTQP